MHEVRLTKYGGVAADIVVSSVICHQLTTMRLLKGDDESIIRADLVVLNQRCYCKYPDRHTA